MATFAFADEPTEDIPWWLSSSPEEVQSLYSEIAPAPAPAPAHKKNPFWRDKVFFSPHKFPSLNKSVETRPMPTGGAWLDKMPGNAVQEDVAVLEASVGGRWRPMTKELTQKSAEPHPLQTAAAIHFHLPDSAVQEDAAVLEAEAVEATMHDHTQDDVFLPMPTDADARPSFRAPRSHLWDLPKRGIEKTGIERGQSVPSELTRHRPRDDLWSQHHDGPDDNFEKRITSPLTASKSNHTSNTPSVDMSQSLDRDEKAHFPLRNIFNGNS